MIEISIHVSWSNKTGRNVIMTKFEQFWQFPSKGDFLSFNEHSAYEISSIQWVKASDNNFYPIIYIYFPRYRPEPDEDPDTLPFWMKEDYWEGLGFYKKN